MKYDNIKLTDFPNWFENYKKQPYETFLNLEIADDEIVAGISENEDYNNVENCTFVKTGHCGGTIVGFPQNITLFAFTNYDNNPLWESKLASYLCNKGINAKIIDNDILIDNCKIAGFMSKWLNKDTQFFGIHISINVDIDLIKRVCVKEMKKIPKGLSDYGITREEILNALEVV